MNKETIIDRLISCKDDHTAFYHWMFGYMCGIEDASGDDSEVVSSSVDDGWIKHDGGPCPVYPGNLVMVRSRNGAESGSLLAKVVAWRHRNGDWDTVAYKVVTPTAS